MEWELSSFEFDVTEYAKCIFGEGIVVRATIDTKLLLESQSITADETKIWPVDSCPLTVLLTNGNTIKIWCSEWGGVNRVDDENKG